MSEFFLWGDFTFTFSIACLPVGKDILHFKNVQCKTLNIKCKSVEPTSKRF